MKKQCVICGKEFETNKRRTYCSMECKAAVERARMLRSIAIRSEKRKAYWAKPDKDLYCYGAPNVRTPKKPKNTGSAAQCERLKGLLLQRRIEREFREATYEDNQTFGGIDDAF